MNDQPVIDSYHQTDLRLTRSALHSTYSGRYRTG